MLHNPDENRSPSNLQSLASPNPFGRLLESVVGSPRSDAMRIIRDAGLHDWSVSAEAPRIITVNSSTGNVKFQYEVLTLRAVHITTPSGSLHLDGACDMAVRIQKAARGAFKSIYYGSVSKTARVVRELLRGRSCDAVTSADYVRTGRDGYTLNGTDSEYRDTAHIRTKYGGVSLYSHRLRPDSSGDSDGGPSRIVVIENSNYSQPSWQEEMYNAAVGFPHPSLHRPQTRYEVVEIRSPGPPSFSPCGARSYFSDKALESIRMLLGTKIGRGEARIDLPEDMVRQGLAWAKANQGRFQR